ncbi:MAG: glycosyltransferase family 25 protein [Moraxella sp.]|nr:glycosyltransferase family 25 protein [Moraxella sp.]
MPNTCQVISLNNATDRRSHIEHTFKAAKVDYEFFDAITPDTLVDMGKLLGLNNLLSNKRLSMGEKSCFLSHIAIWQKMIDDELPYVIVFEDDVLLGENAADIFMDKTWLSIICDNIDVLKFETFYEKVHLNHAALFLSKSLPKENPPRHLYRLKSPQMGAGAYLISSNAAKQLLKKIQETPSHALMAIDHILFEVFIQEFNIYQMKPAIACQLMFQDKEKLPSQLEVHRISNANNSNKLQYTLPQKILNIFKRLKRSIGKRTFYQTIEFK